MRLIDADKLKKHYAWWDNEMKTIFDTVVDVQPTYHLGNSSIISSWEKVNVSSYNEYFNEITKAQCSNCKEIFNDYEDVIVKFHFCPCCGMKMFMGEKL